MRAVLLHAAALGGISPLAVIQDDYDAARNPAGHPTSKRAWRFARNNLEEGEGDRDARGGSYTSAVRALEWRDRAAFEDAPIGFALNGVVAEERDRSW